jgi:hypothetical protein
MKRSIRGPLAAGLLAGVAAVQASAAAGQQPQPAVAEEVTVQQEFAAPGPFGSCAASTESSDAFLAEVARARELESPKAVEAALDVLEPDARRIAAELPNDAAAQYRLAAVMGARLDYEKGGAKMSGAEQVRDQAQRVLALEPQHAGASYMLGRIHASVLRMSGFKRFLAKQLFGGGALEGASWEEAQALLETAVLQDPCVPEHHFELARVYAHQGNDEGAERALQSVRELTASPDGRLASRLREKAEAFEKEWREGSL